MREDYAVEKLRQEQLGFRLVISLSLAAQT